jgi:hypothetical protein
MPTFDERSRHFVESGEESPQESLKNLLGLGFHALDRIHATEGVGMSDTAKGPEPAYHLFLDSEEAPVLARALRLLISDEAHEPMIRGLAREVIANLDATPEPNGKLTVPLTPPQMKITHTATRLLLDDMQREQASEREILRRVLDKLPDEHTMRAIDLR